MKRLLIILGVACPIFLHLAVAEESRIFLALALGIAALFAFLGMVRRWPLWLAIAVAAAIEAPAWFSKDVGTLVLVAWPLAIYVGLGWVFGRTLVEGSQPLVERIARLERGEDMPAELLRHARLVTWAWTVLFAGMAIVSTGLWLLGSSMAWSLFTNVISYFLVGGLFIGEYIYRVLRYSKYQHQNPIQVFRKMLRAPSVFR